MLKCDAPLLRSPQLQPRGSWYPDLQPASALTARNYQSGLIPCKCVSSSSALNNGSSCELYAINAVWTHEAGEQKLAPLEQSLATGGFTSASQHAPAFLAQSLRDGMARTVSGTASRKRPGLHPPPLPGHDQLAIDRQPGTASRSPRSAPWSAAAPSIALAARCHPSSRQTRRRGPRVGVWPSVDEASSRVRGSLVYTSRIRHGHGQNKVVDRARRGQHEDGTRLRSHSSKMGPRVRSVCRWHHARPSSRRTANQMPLWSAMDAV